MQRKGLKSILLLILLCIGTSLITGIIIYQILYSFLIQQGEEFKSAKNTLSQKIEELTQQLTEKNIPEQPKPKEQAPSRKPKEGWEKYFPDLQSTTLIGETTDKIRSLLGDPPSLLKSTAVNPEFSKELWVYHPYDDDPTGLYLFFEGNKVTKGYLNEFNGFSEFSLFD